MPKHYHRHQLDIYGVTLYVTTSERGWKKIQARCPFDDINPAAAGWSSVGQFIPDDGGPGETSAAVYINGLQPDTERIDTCAHEAAHIAVEIMDRISSPTTGEPFAYLVGWLTRWLWEHTSTDEENTP